MSTISEDRDLEIVRVPGLAPGRSAATAYQGIVWSVASSLDKQAAFKEQVQNTFQRLELILHKAGSNRSRLLSVTVMLAKMEDKEEFDGLWRSWVGDSSHHWPQRCCVQCTLSAGTLVEITAISATA